MKLNNAAPGAVNNRYSGRSRVWRSFGGDVTFETSTAGRYGIKAGGPSIGKIGWCFMVAP